MRQFFACFDWLCSTSPRGWNKTQLRCSVFAVDVPLYVISMACRVQRSWLTLFFLFALFQVAAHWVEEKSFTKITPRTNDITKMFAFVDIHSLFLFSWFGCGSEFLHIHRYTLNLTVGFWVEKSWFWILILTVLRSNL